MPVSILPHNATPLELQVERLISEGHPSVPFRQLWSPENCPVELLPWLAHSFSVDVWDPEWSEATKRAVISESVAIHRTKGTRGALQRALVAVGFSIDITEGWEEGGAAHTFRLDAYGEDVFAEGLTIDQELRARLDQLVEAVKPARSHYTMRIGQTVKTSVGLRCGASAKQVIDAEIKPRAAARQSNGVVSVRAVARSQARFGGAVQVSAPERTSSVTIASRFAARGRLIVGGTFSFTQGGANVA